ncbi:reverse transcriptase domain-containing protein [Tanacetum coccineum]
MHTRASNSELVEPLPEPERTLNRRLHRQNRRVPFEQRNNPPQQPRVVYAPILDINYFRHFLDILQKPFLKPQTNLPLKSYSSSIGLKTKKTKSSLKKIVAFADEGSSNSDTDKIMARMDAMTMKIDARYKEFQSCSKPNPDHNDDDIPMSREEEEKFLQTFHHTFMDLKNKLETTAKNHQASIQNLKAKFDSLADKQSGRPSGSLPIPPKLGDPGSFLIPCNFNKAFLCNALASLGASINLFPYSLYAKLSLETLKPTKMSVRLADRSFQYPVGIAENMLVEVGKFTFPADFVILQMEEDNKVPLILEDLFFTLPMHIDVIDEILEEDFDALLNEGSEIFHSIEGTILEEKLFAEFDEFMAMTVDENSEFESDTEEPPSEKITFNIDYKIKISLGKPPTDLEIKPLPDNLEYAFLEEPFFLPVIISSQLSEQNKKS